MWRNDSLQRATANLSYDIPYEIDEVPQILANGYSFAERCQRLGEAIEWIKREMVSPSTELWLVKCVA